MSVRGLNHLTLAVVDLARSLDFYTGVLGLQLRAQWPNGAYLEAGPLWLCLSVDLAAASRPHPDYSHVAFDVGAADFAALRERIIASAPIWRGNRSEGSSLYFIDPDGHKLELHVGSLETRLAHYRAERPDGMVLF